MIVEEWSGLGTLDQHINGGNWTTVSTFTTSATGTLAQASEMVTGLFVSNSNTGTPVTPGTGFTQDASSPVASGANTELSSCYQIVNSTTGIGVQMSWVNSTSGRTAVATYRVTAAPAVASVAGGTGSPEDEERRKRRRILALQKNPNPRKASQVFREEMEKLEAGLQSARNDREEIEATAVGIGLADAVPDYVQRFIIAKERQLNRRHVGVALYYQANRERRLSAIERLQRLAKIARYREQVAEEALRKVKERIDEDAAVAFMQTMLREF